MKKIYTFALSGFMIVTTVATAHAQFGVLDNTFGSGGKVITGLGVGGFSAVVIQSDGKILVAGGLYDANGLNFGLLRYNTDGTLDNTFDTDGKVVTDVGTGGDAAYALALQSDGKILVGGSSGPDGNGDFALARYNTDGSLDTDFDTDGIVMTAISANDDVINSIAIQSNGKIVVAGQSYASAALARYNTDGSLDTDFDTDGKLITTIAGSWTTYAHSVAIQSDGKIVAGGMSGSTSDTDFTLFRYNDDGSLDVTFDTDGIVTTDFGINGYDYCHSINIQSNGKIVAAGESRNATNFDFSLARYNDDGSLDVTFDTDGKVTTAVGSADDNGLKATIQIDGKIVMVGGSRDIGTAQDDVFTIIRYNTNGSLDNTFGTGGIVTTVFDHNDSGADAVAIQPDQKIVVAGHRNGGGAALGRYDSGLVGIAENSELIELSIYPNPGYGVFQLQVTDKMENARILVANSLGEIVYSEQLDGGISQHELDLNFLSDGVYFLRLENGTTSSTQKLVITKN